MTSSPAEQPRSPGERLPHSEIRVSSTEELSELDEPVFVDVLTDEELSVLSRPGPMPVSPFLDGLPDDERDLARRSAYRSLIARGVLDPPTPQAVASAARAADGSLDLQVRQDIASVVALREGARLVVALARTTATGQDFWYAHVVDDVVLLEEVSRDGFHRFALARGKDLPGTVVKAAIDPEAGDASGAPQLVSTPPADPTPPMPLLERLGAAFVRTEVVIRHTAETGPMAFSVLSGPAGCWVIEPPTAPGAQTSAVPMTAFATRQKLVDAVIGVRAEMEALDG